MAARLIPHLLPDSTQACTRYRYRHGHWLQILGSDIHIRAHAQESLCLTLSDNKWVHNEVRITMHNMGAHNEVRITMHNIQ